jgi:hypothetical protein
MKIILTESQFNRVLSEQVKATLTPSNQSSSLKPTMNVASGTINPTKGSMPVDPHTLMTILAIGTAFIPVAGPFISAGIGLVDAALYYKEGDKTSAGVTAAFSMIPFIGKIPGVKEFGSKAMAALGSKVAKGIKVFTPAETKILNVIKQNESLVKQGLESASKQLSPITKSINQLKPNYIQKLGQQSYDDLLEKLLSNKIDKSQFLQTLQKSEASTANLAVKGGIKMLRSELSVIKNLASEVLYGEGGMKSISVMTRNGEKKVSVLIANTNTMKKFFPNNMGAEAFARGDDMIVLVKDNLKNFDKLNIEELLTHEVTHLKDPANVSSKLAKSYLKKGEEATFKNYFGHQFEKTAELTASLNNMNSTVLYWKKYIPKDQLLSYLDEIINYSKGTVKNLSKEANSIIGSNGIDGLTELVKDPQSFRKFASKIAQQATYLKSQVNVAM